MIYHDNTTYTILPIHEYKLCFVLHQKSANTSVKRMIKTALGIKKLTRREINWNWDFLSPAEVPVDYYTVSIVRDPIERVKSLYADKFGGQGSVGSYLAEIGFTQKMTFAEYVNLLCNQSDRIIDKHLRQQTFSLYTDDRCIADKIYKLETIEWQNFRDKIYNKTGFFLDVEVEFANTTHPERKSFVENLMTPELLEKLKFRYRDDLRLLGYFKWYQDKE